MLDAARYRLHRASLLEGKADEAVALARRDGPPVIRNCGQRRCCADWATTRPRRSTAAWRRPSANEEEGRDDLAVRRSIRLAQIAAAAGRHDQAKQFADLLPDESAKAWAKGDAGRLRIALAPKDKADEGWVEVPTDPKALRAGHAWGRMWVARQNTRLSGKLTPEVTAVTAWPSPLVPFGKAGVALGLQDRDK